MKSIFKSNFIVIAFLILVIMSLLFMGQAGILYNQQVQGWLYGKDAQFAGERIWGTTGTADTLVITGVDVTCVVMLTAKTAMGDLSYDIEAAGDTVFVTSGGSETAATDKYGYIVIKNGYNASD